MRDLDELADQSQAQADEVRAIALGIFDFKERKRLLDFADDYQRLARAVKGRDLGVALPTRRRARVAVNGSKSR